MFQASLSAAQADFNQLAALDKQIKSFNVGPNPYTWFTMEALEETWKNLQKIIKVSKSHDYKSGKTYLNLTGKSKVRELFDCEMLISILPNIHLQKSLLIL